MAEGCTGHQDQVTANPFLIAANLVSSDDDEMRYVPNDDLPFAPNPGRQTEFVRSDVDVVFYGGTAGSGKSAGIMQAVARLMHIPGYDAIIFRRNMTDALKPGSTWAETYRFFPQINGKPNQGNHSWRFPSGASLTIGHLDLESTVENYMSSQIPFIGFDELTHFTEPQFWYMFSRLRSMSGGPAYIRAGMNPDPDSFAATMIEWWIDEEGFPIAERSGVVKYFVRDVNGALVWADNPETLRASNPDDGEPTSFTFIAAKLTDNPKLLARDPKYEDRLKKLPYIERMRLLYGNWKVRPSAGLLFSREDFRDVAKVPDGVGLLQVVRYWDNAGSTDGRADRTAGVKMSMGDDGATYVLDAVYIREEAPARERFRKQVAEADGEDCHIFIEQEPGSSGKDVAIITTRNLAGYVVHSDRVTGPKVTRWGPWQSQVEAGNVYLVGPKDARWKREFREEHHNADGSDNVHDDIVDAAAGGFNQIAHGTIGFM